MNLIDLTGQRFGKLIVIGKMPRHRTNEEAVWLCRCDCGKQTSVRGTRLRSGNTVSCGCRKVKHNESHNHRTRLYSIWKGMRQRCSNPNNTHYKYYGGRGISVCSAWSEFPPFRDWALANGYEESLTIDRINVNDDYCPSNCRWVDRKTQVQNRRKRCS